MRSKASWIIMGLIGLYGLFWLSLGILYGGLLASRVAETPQSVDTPVGVMCTAIPAYYMENGLLYELGMSKVCIGSTGFVVADTIWPAGQGVR